MATGGKPAVELQAQRARILELRLEGYTTAQIATKLSMQEKTVRNNLKAAVAMVDATSYLEEMQVVTMNRLEHLLRVAWDRATGTGQFDGEPDIDWYHAALKVIERQCKLLGMDAPKRVDIALIVEEWAIKNGYDPSVVVDTFATLLPSPSSN